MLAIGPASDLVPLRAIMAETGALSACLAIALFRRGSRARSWWEGPSVGIDRLGGPSRIERERPGPCRKRGRYAICQPSARSCSSHRRR